MEKAEQKRRELTEKMADHLLQKGFSGFTLRSLAAAAGTSDRMLLHYFVDKNELLTATLTLIAGRLVSLLEGLQPGQMSQPQLISFLAGLLTHPEVLPYTNLWLELASVATREGDPYRMVASQIAGAYLTWIKSTLAIDESARDNSAAFILTFVEGLVVVNAVGRNDEAMRALTWALNADPA